jgi:Calcium binding
MIMSEARKSKKTKPERDNAREARISMEIVVDAYGEEERAISWYYYLEEHLHMPFLARCIEERAVSPIRVGKEVEVLKMAPEDECKREILVSVRWENRSLAVPLSGLEVVHGDEETKQAVEDWHYWVEMGYEF